MRTTLYAGLIAVTSALILVACGGGGSTTGVAAGVSGTTISGTAVKGPIANATVTVRNASTGASLATTTTTGSGTYSVSVTFNGDVILEVTGGTYTDESTGAATTLSTPLRAVLTAAGGTATGHITPLTTLAYNYAQTTGGAVTAARFTTVAATLASQFRLGEVNLLTTRPDPANPDNSYGLALKALSKYLDTNRVTLQSLLTQAFTQADWNTFSTAYSNAYLAANGSTVSFNFDGSALNIGGTGAGGGTGTCGVAASGTVTSGGFTVPVNFNYCISGIAGGSCTAGNSALNQSLSSQQGAGGANLTYTYSSTCAANAIAINLQ